MVKPSRAALLVLVLSALAPLGGCELAFDLVGVAQPLSAGESRRFNGSYQGSIDQVASNGPACPRESGEKVLMVGDGVLWYAYTPTVLFTSPIRYDGTIEATSADTTMRGKVTGNHMDVVVKSPTCETRMSLNYIYNH